MMLGSQCSPCCVPKCDTCGPLLILPAAEVIQIGPSVSQSLIWPWIGQSIGPGIAPAEYSRNEEHVQPSDPSASGTVTSSLKTSYSNCEYIAEFEHKYVYDSLLFGYISYTERVASVTVSFVGTSVRIGFTNQGQEIHFFSGVPSNRQPYYDINVETVWEIPLCVFDRQRWDPQNGSVDDLLSVEGRPFRFFFSEIDNPTNPDPQVSGVTQYKVSESKSILYWEYNGTLGAFVSKDASFNAVPRLANPKIAGYPIFAFPPEWNPDCIEPCNPLP